MRDGLEMSTRSTSLSNCPPPSGASCEKSSSLAFLPLFISPTHTRFSFGFFGLASGDLAAGSLSEDGSLSAIDLRSVPLFSLEVSLDPFPFFLSLEMSNAAVAAAVCFARAALSAAPSPSPSPPTPPPLAPLAASSGSALALPLASLRLAAFLAASNALGAPLGAFFAAAFASAFFVSRAKSSLNPAYVVRPVSALS